MTAYVNMAVVTACLGKSSLVGSSGSLLETSMLYTYGSECIGLVAKTESEKNMVKLRILDWNQLMTESQRKGHTFTSSFVSPEKILSNYCIISNNGFVIVRFHWHNMLWDDNMEQDIILACSLLTRCIWHNC
jgi:hypothetical protein